MLRNQISTLVSGPRRGDHNFFEAAQRPILCGVRLGSQTGTGTLRIFRHFYFLGGRVPFTSQNNSCVSFRAYIVMAARRGGRRSARCAVISARKCALSEPSQDGGKERMVILLIDYKLPETRSFRDSTRWPTNYLRLRSRFSGSDFRNAFRVP